MPEQRPVALVTGGRRGIGRAVAMPASGLIPYATGSALFVDGGFNVKRF
jgi:enoyl-[acyl-carrier-protein] reductase (NADH)